jgi:deazaflavin-dependent oxidoreductase (nitroreductase family)
MSSDDRASLARPGVTVYRCACNYVAPPELAVDAATRTALDHNQVIDMTTIGRRTGQPRRIEIYLHNLGGRLVISGRPAPGRTRAWLYNVAADPRVTLHLKGPLAVADVSARARVITDPAERRELIVGVARNWKRTDIDVMVAHSPLIELTVPGYRDAIVAA